MMSLKSLHVTHLSCLCTLHFSFDASTINKWAVYHLIHTGQDNVTGPPNSHISCTLKAPSSIVSIRGWCVVKYLLPGFTGTACNCEPFYRKRFRQVLSLYFVLFQLMTKKAEFPYFKCAWHIFISSFLYTPGMWSECHSYPFCKKAKHYIATFSTF